MGFYSVIQRGVDRRGLASMAVTNLEPRLHFIVPVTGVSTPFPVLLELTITKDKTSFPTLNKEGTAPFLALEQKS